jgi:hypothetical protein
MEAIFMAREAGRRGACAEVNNRPTHNEPPENTRPSTLNRSENKR